MNKADWSNPCPKADCRKDACKCGLKKDYLPAALGDDSDGSPIAPKNGDYCNSIVVYEANNHVYIYSADGIPTLFSVDAHDVAQLEEDMNRAQGDIVNLRNEVRGLADEFIYGFNTVAEMQSSTELVNGSYAITLGYHSTNDGGAALYKITNSGTPNGMNVLSVNNGLVASLVITDDVNPKQFGAYGDNSHDDSSVLQYIISNYNDVFIPSYDYLTNSTLTITRSNQIIKCDGTIRYQGNGAAIRFQTGTNNNFYIRNINSNGVGVLVEPTGSCGGIKLSIDIINSRLEAFKVTGNKPASSWYLNGIRWNSSAGYAVTFTIPSGASDTWFNRFIFQNMALLAHPNDDTKGIILTNNVGTSCDIQVEFDHVNFEGAKGIRTTGYVAYLNIEHCRISEVSANDWLEFNGYIPHCTITSPGRVDLSHIHFNNITAGERVKFLCSVYSGGYEYINGEIYRSSDNKIMFTSPDNIHTVYTADSDTNTVGDDVVDPTAPYVIPFQIRVENTNAATEVNVPNYIYNYTNQILLNVTTSTTVTMKYGTRTVTDTFAQGKYMLYNFGNFCYYVPIT